MHWVLVLYALFASVFVISKVGLQYAQPVFFVGSRMFVAGLLLLAYVFFFQRDRFCIKKGTVPKLLLLAFFNIYLTNVCEFWGLKYLTSFKTCFIYSLSPFIAALLSYLLFSEKLTGKKWIGLIIGFIGFVPMLLSETTGEEELGHLFFFSWAELSVMTAATATVCGWILMQRLVKGDGYSPLMANGVSMLVGGALALVHSYFFEAWHPVPVTEWRPFLETAVLSMVISSLICYNLYGVLLKRFSNTFMSFAGFTTPLFTALMGWFFLGEVISWHFYVSVVLVFTGLSVFYQEELQKGLRVADKTLV